MEEYYETWNAITFRAICFDESFKDRYENPQAVVDDTPYYTDEEVKKYGCLAIHFKKLEK